MKQTIKFKILMVCSIIFSFLLASCSEDNEGKEPNEALTSLFCGNEWYEFYTDGSGYLIYSFDNHGGMSIAHHDLKEIWQTESGTYSCYDEIISMKNSYGAQTDYSVSISGDYCISLNAGGKSKILYRALQEQELWNRLVGQWECYDANIDWYMSYTFNADRSYEYEQIVNKSIHEEESGPGNYVIQDDVWIEFTPEKFGAYKAVFYIDVDGNLVLISPYSKGSVSIYYKVDSEHESCRPNTTQESQSPFYDEIKGSRWLSPDDYFKDEESGKYVNGFKLMEFTNSACTVTSIFKNKKIAYRPISSGYHIEDNTLSCGMNGDFEIQMMANEKVTLNKAGEIWVKYDDDFINNFIGIWEVRDMVLELKSDGTYSLAAYENAEHNVLEENFNGSYSIEPGFISFSPLPEGFLNTTGYFHYVTDFNNKTMQWHHPYRTGTTDWVKTTD